MTGYDFRRLVFSALIFVGFMYLVLFTVSQLGSNYDKDMSDFSGDIFDEDNWILGTTSAYEDAESIRNASVTASVTNLDEPTSSKSIYENIIDMVLLPFHLIFTMASVVLNIPQPIMYILATILLIEIVLVVWRLLKVGD